MNSVAQVPHHVCGPLSKMKKKGITFFNALSLSLMLLLLAELIRNFRADYVSSVEPSYINKKKGFSCLLTQMSTNLAKELRSEDSNWIYESIPAALKIDGSVLEYLEKLSDIPGDPIIAEEYLISVEFISGSLFDSNLRYIAIRLNLRFLKLP